MEISWEYLGIAERDLASQSSAVLPYDSPPLSSVEKNVSQLQPQMMPRAAAPALSTAQPPDTPCAGQAGFSDRSCSRCLWVPLLFRKAKPVPSPAAMILQAVLSFHISGSLEELNVPKPQYAAAEAEDMSNLVYNSKEKYMYLSPWHRLDPLRI